eukprot:CCRYP_019409-RD/>CCRYP_019409-RD protein AED:0.39 eAED:1.00 QI:0/-1/0/1/-1/0/1/0/37
MPSSFNAMLSVEINGQRSVKACKGELTMPSRTGGILL